MVLDDKRKTWRRVEVCGGLHRSGPRVGAALPKIRELEKIPIVRTKGFDPTEAGGHGLLEEMSVAELRERIEFNRRKIEQDTEKKR